MLSPLLDNLTAVVIGTAILTTVIILQTRQRITSVDETIHHVARNFAQEAMSTFSADLQNAINNDRAQQTPSNGGFRTTSNPVANASFSASGTRSYGSPVLGHYLFGADTLANGLTGWLAFPAMLEDPSVSALRPAQVVYRLIPADSSGTADSVFVHGERRALYQLERWTTFEPNGVEPPSDEFQPVSPGVIVDFRVGLMGYSTEATRRGAAPQGVNAFSVSLMTAVDGVEQISTGQFNRREQNSARVGVIVRPSDL